jgi:hypothetical protein
VENDQGNEFEETGKVLLFESLEEVVRDWSKRKKDQPTKCLDCLDVCGKVALGRKQAIRGVFSV